MRTVSDVSQSSRGRVSTRRALHWRIAANWTVVSWRADIIQCCVPSLHTSLSHVADLVGRSTALVRSSNRASTSAEVTLSTLFSGTSKAGRTAIVTRCALGAFADVPEAVAVTVGTIGTQVFSGKARSCRAVAARWARYGMCRVTKTVTASRTSLYQSK